MKKKIRAVLEVRRSGMGLANSQLAKAITIVVKANINPVMPHRNIGSVQHVVKQL